MGVEAGVVSVNARLELTSEPGMFLTARAKDDRMEVDLHFSGATGVRSLSRLIEVAAELRTELEARL